MWRRWIQQALILVFLTSLNQKGGAWAQVVQLINTPPNTKCGYVESDLNCFKQLTTNSDKVCNEIIGGDQVSAGCFPYIVSLQIIKDLANDCYYHFCGASLIAPDVLLTAAHCIQEVAPTNKREGIMSIPVFAALAPKCRHMGSSIADAPARVKVAYFILHPQYTRFTLENDIAVVKLEEPLSAPNGPFAKYKLDSTARIENGLLNTNYPSLVVVGYGDTNTEESKLKQYNLRHLRAANIQYLGDASCSNMLKNNTSTYRELVPELMMCAFNRTADACSGDSGGPLVITGIGQEDGQSGDYRTHLQVGIVSWGPGDACTNQDQQTLGVYTQLDQYGSWLDEAIVQLNNSVALSQASSTVQNGAPVDGTQGVNECLSDRGCKCKDFWQYQGRSYNGCNNPDQDPSGNWCIVDVKGCLDQPSGSISVTGEFWDSCGCIQQESLAQAKSNVGCPSTKANCKCKSEWQHSEVWYQGCANPDNDPLGAWCHVQEVDFSMCSNSGGIQVDTRQVNDETQQFLSYFDYCKDECA